MAMRIFPLLACLAVLLLISCNRPAAPPAPSAAAPLAGPEPKAAPPSCGVESPRAVKLDDGTELLVWNLKANGLKQLTARLLVATDGKVQTANEVEYKWDKWEPTAPEASGQLVLLLQDGRAFGVKGKRLPLLALDLQGSPSHAKTDTKMGLLLEGELHLRLTGNTPGNSLAKRSIIYAQLFSPKDDVLGRFSLGSDLESVAASSKDGRTVIAVALESSPQQ